MTHNKAFAAAMKNLLGASAFLLSACASAPQPYCIPPELTRAPEATGDAGSTVPRASADPDEYVRCKQMEADIRQEAQLREDEARAKQREAERLERELKEVQEQEQKPNQ